MTDQLGWLFLWNQVISAADHMCYRWVLGTATPALHEAAEPLMLLVAVLHV
jgi:hypothetical protein